MFENLQYTKPLDSDPETTDLMTVGEFLDAVRCGMFTDDDGIGELVRMEGSRALGVVGRSGFIFPSQVASIPAAATHIAWYNK